MPRKPFYPLALNLEGRRCLVIGEDREATEKSAVLEECGALVERATPASVTDGTVGEFFFVLSTIKDEVLTARLHALSQSQRFLLWCVDRPASSSVSMMSIARSGPVRVAASTSGAAPAISKTFRKALEGAMDAKFARFIEHLSSLRERLRESKPARSQTHERVDAMLEASRNFGISVSFRYPEWFERS